MLKRNVINKSVFGAGRLRQRWLWLAPLLAAGLGVRLWAMRWPPFPIDMQDWIVWGERVLALGPANFYSDAVFADYAPGYVYVMWLTAALKNALFPAPALGVYHFLYRLTPILVDLATGILIYKLVAGEELKLPQQPEPHADINEAAPPIALLAAASHLFNPAIIFNSAVWGQIDSTFTFALLLSLVLLVRGRAEWAVATYVIGFMIKPQAISLAPVLGIFLLLRYPPRRWLTAGATGLVLGYLICAPFLGFNAYGRLISLLRKSVETYPYTSLFTYNIWALYGMWQDDRVPFWFDLSVRTTGTLLYLAGIAYGVVLLLRRLRRTESDLATLFLFGTYFTFLPVMVLTRMHERYLYPVLPFMLVLSGLYAVQRNRKLGIRGLSWRILGPPYLMYLVLAALHTLNLYHVYTFYHNYNAGVPRTNTLFYFIDDYVKLWSVATLLIFAGLAAALLFWTRRFRPGRERGGRHELAS